MWDVAAGGLGLTCNGDQAEVCPALWTRMENGANATRQETQLGWCALISRMVYREDYWVLEPIPARIGNILARTDSVALVCVLSRELAPTP
eukprot:910332-Prymnesium_polylepis.1